MKRRVSIFCFLIYSGFLVIFKVLFFIFLYLGFLYEVWIRLVKYEKGVNFSFGIVVRLFRCKVFVEKNKNRNLFLV